MLVVDLECDFIAGGGRFQEVIEDGACGRVRSNRRFGRQRGIVIFAAADADGVRGRVETRILIHGFLVPLAERRDVVENPEGAAVGGDDQIVAVNDEIADGTGRQIILQRAPGIAVVEGNEDARFRFRRKEDLCARGLRAPRGRKRFRAGL